MEAPGEAAFYGPKIDIQIRDIAGREFEPRRPFRSTSHQPERFDLSYVDADGGRRRGRSWCTAASVGSMERLVAHLIEVHQGALPAWYAPVQLAVAPVAAAAGEAARQLADAALRLGLRVEVSHDGSLGARIREAVRQKCRTSR